MRPEIFLVVEADVCLKTEGNITAGENGWPVVAPPGSESVACLEGKLSERGIPLSLSSKRVLPDKPKQRGRQNGAKGVGEAILYRLKRVMIVEGRASAELFPEEKHRMVNKAKLTEETN